MEETQRSVGDGQQSLDLPKGVDNVSVAWEVETKPLREAQQEHAVAGVKALGCEEGKPWWLDAR